MSLPFRTLAALGVAGLALPAALGATLAGATPAGAAAPSQSVPVLNGDFADPAMTGDGPTTVGIDFWTGSNQRYSPSASGRTDNAHGVALQKDNNSLHQRLRGVRTGAKVTVSYEDSPAVSKECTPEQVADGQPYTVEGSGGTAQAVTTAGDPDRTKGRAGSGRWTARSYTFTATENEPLLTFTSKVSNSRTHVTCSPMIAKVRVTEVPTDLDKRVSRMNLERSEAYKGNERQQTLHNAAAACNGENACVFRPDTRMSFRYYGQARVIGEAFVNCTRNPLEHTRVLSYAERTHDSIAQTYVDAGIALTEESRLPSTGDREEDRKRIKERPMATQFALAYEKGWQRPWQWFSSDRREIEENIQPGEVSWVELQPSRERVEGWFHSNKQDYRLHAVIDGPSRAVPDRILQRTGPMSESEKQRCAAARPMTSTPVGADAPAGSADKGLLEIPAPTAPGVRTVHGTSAD
ncbi:hypothetical protein [Streptomyces sp. NPDC058620]|uniref:hypothetical protein n=1 Tax=Streptomyces sp. NPDC058620 TaxID=3346560 RepID=UPI003659618F